MKPMSKIVTTVTDVIIWFILTFGIYIVLHGHLTPGGGFQGGAVLASAVALFVVAYGKDRARAYLSKNFYSVVECLGLVLFTIVGFAGMKATFLYNLLAGTGGLFGNVVTQGVNPGDLNTAGIIPILNVGIGLEVVGGLSLIVISMLWGLWDVFGVHEERGGIDV